MKLHLACGSEKLPGYINIDIVKTEAADKVMDCLNLEGFEKNSIEEIVVYHFIEHITLDDFKKAFVHWWTFLQPGGKLILECPDLKEICGIFYNATKEEQYVSYNAGPALINHIFGRTELPEFEHHKCGFTKEFLKDSLSFYFDNINFDNPPHRDYRIPCIRLEATKKRF